MKPTSAFPTGIDAERGLDRRRFLCTAGAAAALALSGEWLAQASAERSVRPIEIALRADDTPAAGAARSVAGANGTEALVVRVDAETVVAFDRRCPHLGCPVLWSAARGRFECPCHHAAFDARTGAVLAGPPRRGLNPCTVRIV